jgi:hypothetical protein
MRTRLPLVAIAALSIASADTLTLRDGRTVEGQFLGGTARQVRMAVGDSVQTFDVSDIASLQFEGAKLPSPAPLPPPSAPPAASTDAGDIPAGTAVTIRMIDGVDSKTAQAGQTFRASIDEPVVVGDETAIPRGADVVTQLVEVKEPGKLAGGGQLTLSLVSINIDGDVVDVNSQSVTQAGESRKGQSAKVIGGTAALGAIIGALASGGRGAAIGAVAGAGAGTAVQVLTKGTEIRIPSETRLTFTLDRAVPLP